MNIENIFLKKGRILISHSTSQSPMQSCRSLQYLSIFANVSKVVRKLNKLTKKIKKSPFFSIKYKHTAFGSP